MTWHPRSFENLEQFDVVEFYANGVDPNVAGDASPWHEGPVEVKTAPKTPAGMNGAPTGLMVLAGSQGDRVRSDEHSPWIKAGGYRGTPLR